MPKTAEIASTSSSDRVSSSSSDGAPPRTASTAARAASITARAAIVRPPRTHGAPRSAKSSAQAIEIDITTTGYTAIELVHWEGRAPLGFASKMRRKRYQCSITAG